MFSKKKSWLTNSELTAISAAIANAELKTSGEIRVHVEEYCKGDVLDRAAFMFAKLEMHKTALRNGVLFYLATTDRKFAVIGDAGINRVVPPDFWDEVKNEMSVAFARGEYVSGLENAVQHAGQILSSHFPRQSDDRNELSNEVSVG